MSVVSSVITFIMLLAAIRAFEMSEIDATCNLFLCLFTYIKYIKLLGLPSATCNSLQIESAILPFNCKFDEKLCRKSKYLFN